jgi:hypothetical protein
VPVDDPDERAAARPDRERPGVDYLTESGGHSMRVAEMSGDGALDL